MDTADANNCGGKRHGTSRCSLPSVRNWEEPAKSVRISDGGPAHLRQTKYRFSLPSQAFNFGMWRSTPVNYAMLSANCKTSTTTSKLHTGHLDSPKESRHLKPSVLIEEYCIGYNCVQMCTGLIWLKIWISKGKAVPLNAWGGQKGSRKLRFPDFLTTAQDGGKCVSLTHRPHLTPGNTPGTHFC
jgi:hypothetical protein